MSVQVDDGAPQTVSDLGRLTVPEGRHRVKMSGPVADTQDIDMQTGYFERFFSKPVWRSTRAARRYSKRRRCTTPSIRADQKGG